MTLSPTAHHQFNKLADSMVRPFFAVALVLMIIVALLSDAVYDAGDGITHYEIARWSWRHPELFLHHWGKPLFTLLASPFAQFGYKGIVVFNVLCHVSAAWVTWRIADRMKLPFAFLAGPLVIFTPISWGVAQSGLTEPLFALLLISGIYFVTGARNVAAAVLISLLPFARTEGFFMAPLFGLFFLIRRDYLSAALLGSGTLLFSIAGGLFVHHDFLWVIHDNPYVGYSVYGRGGFFHFVGQSEFIFGWAMTVMIPLGFMTLLFRKRIEPAHSLAEIVLVFGTFFVFYGLIRVIACVVPCAVIISLRGIKFTTRFYSGLRPAIALTLTLVAGLTVFNTFRQMGLVLQPDDTQITARKVVAEITTQKLENRFLYFGHPLIRYLLEKDPYDNTQCLEMYGLRVEPNPVKDALVIWDSHFGPVQFDMTEAQLREKPQLIELFRIDDREDKTGPGNGKLWIVCVVK
jgi:hypothetical protein